MTSEPITSPSADAVTANSVLLIVDAESLLSRYPQPSLDPQKPTVIEDGFIFAISATTAAQNIINDSKIILTTNNGKVFHIRGRTVSLLAEHTVVFHNMTVHDTGILSPPKLIVHGDQTVPSPAPSNPTQPGSHSADDLGMCMAQQYRAPGTDQVNQLVAVDVVEVRSASARDESRRAADRSERSNR